MDISDDIDEKDLLIQLQRGDYDAFAQLYERYATLIYRRIHRLVHVHEYAEELVQDVFLQIWERREKLPIGVPFHVVLLRYAKSSAINFYRKAVKDAQIREKWAQSASAYYEPIDEEINFGETKALIDAAIAKLPPQRQKIFVLCKIEGKSYEEVANLFGISVGTVKDHMAKAMRTLKQEIGNNPSISYFSVLYLTYLFF